MGVTPSVTTLRHRHDSLHKQTGSQAVSAVSSQLQAKKQEYIFVGDYEHHGTTKTLIDPWTDPPRGQKRTSESVEAEVATCNIKRHKRHDKDGVRDASSLLRDLRHQRPATPSALLKPMVILLRHIEIYNRQQKNKTHILLELAHEKHAPEQLAADKILSHLGTDGKWRYEAGRKRGGQGYAVRQVATSDSTLAGYSESWQAVFSSPIAAQQFFSTCYRLPQHDRGRLERYAIDIVRAAGGNVYFIREPQFFVREPRSEVSSPDPFLDFPKHRHWLPLSALPELQDWQISNQYVPGERERKTSDRDRMHTRALTKVIPFQSAVKAVPLHKWHRPLARNILAQNERRLRVWPSLEDTTSEKNQEKMESELTQKHRTINPNTRRAVESPILVLQTQHLSEQVIEPFLSATLKHHTRGVTTRELVLHYFLHPARTLNGEIPSDVRSLWLKRMPLNRSNSKLSAVYQSLPEITNRQLAAATVVCAAYEEVLGHSLWSFIKPELELIAAYQCREVPDNEDALDMLCRICYVRNCFEHGILSDGEDSEEDQPDLINLKQYMQGRKATAKPTQASITISSDKTFLPCSHPGPCAESAQCDCFQSNRLCEKSCHCGSECIMRFPGCSCVRRGQICATNECLCYANSRECDGDLCGVCGASEILDRYAIAARDDTVLRGRCANVSILRGVRKRTLLRNSQVHDFGLGAGQDIAEDDFIGEYCGEIVSSKEADRRGVEYFFGRSEYLWKIHGQQQEIDATRAGNKFRFVNHSRNIATVNIASRQKFCNGVWRVGFWALRNIQAGEELFFDYGYSDEQTKHFREPGQANAGFSTTAQGSQQRKSNGSNKRSGLQDRKRTNSTFQAGRSRSTSSFHSHTEELGDDGEGNRKTRVLMPVDKQRRLVLRGPSRQVQSVNTSRSSSRRGGSRLQYQVVSKVDGADSDDKSGDSGSASNEAIRHSIEMEPRRIDAGDSPRITQKAERVVEDSCSDDDDDANVAHKNDIKPLERPRRKRGRPRKYDQA